MMKLTMKLYATKLVEYVCVAMQLALLLFMVHDTSRATAASLLEAVGLLLAMVAVAFVWCVCDVKQRRYYTRISEHLVATGAERGDNWRSV